MKNSIPKKIGFKRGIEYVFLIIFLTISLPTSFLFFGVELFPDSKLAAFCMGLLGLAFTVFISIFIGEKLGFKSDWRPAEY